MPTDPRRRPVPTDSPSALVAVLQRHVNEGRSVYDLARAAGVPERTLRNLLTGKRLPKGLLAVEAALRVIGKLPS